MALPPPVRVTASQQASQPAVDVWAPDEATSSSSFCRVPLPPDDPDNLYQPPASPVDSQQAESVYDYSSSLSDRSDDSGFGSLRRSSLRGPGRSGGRMRIRCADGEVVCGSCRQTAIFLPSGRESNFSVV